MNDYEFNRNARTTRLLAVAAVLREQLAILDDIGAFAAAAPLSQIVHNIERECQLSA